MHILCKSVRVHFPDVHVMHHFHQSFIFRRAGKKLFFSLQKKKKKEAGTIYLTFHVASIFFRKAELCFIFYYTFYTLYTCF